jgi:hypothetical protein
MSQRTPRGGCDGGDDRQRFRAHRFCEGEECPSPPSLIARMQIHTQAIPTMAPSIPNAASSFLSFVNASPTPFHVVHTATKLLSQAGFVKLSEKDDFAAKFKNGELVKGGKYYYTR